MRWRRIAGLVMRRPAAFATAASIVLLVLASPLLGVRFTGAQSPTTLPDSVSAGYVAEQLRQDFPDLRTDREELVIQAPPSAAQEVGDYASRVAEVGGVSAVDRPHPIDADHWLATVTLAGEPISAGNQAAMTAIGDLPSGFAVRAAGCTADVVALDGSLGRHLPTGVLVLVIATLLMLFAMTGSVVLPIKSVLMNALSLGASVGIVVWIFQLGNLAALFGTTGQGALESTSPLYLGAVAFGLSTDYGVFLLSRIKEARDQGMDDLSAIRSGVENTGRLVTSAAALMCLAMCAMILSRMAFIKELGLGAALAVIIDASIVRAVLVPALMVLLGGVNWWAPAPLRALHSWLRVDRIEAPVSTPADMTAYETVPNQ
jgi:RND superfamily putative drug exporter